jgi:hypothetical protein
MLIIIIVTTSTSMSVSFTWWWACWWMMMVFHCVFYLDVVSLNLIMVVMRGAVSVMVVSFFFFWVVWGLGEGLWTGWSLRILVSFLNDRMCTSYQWLKIQMHFPMFLNYLINHPPCLLIFLQWPLNKHIPQVRMRYLLLSHLYPRPTFKLQWPYSIAPFAYNETDTLVRHGYYVCVGARRPVWGQ